MWAVANTTISGSGGRRRGELRRVEDGGVANAGSRTQVLTGAALRRQRLFFQHSSGILPTLPALPSPTSAHHYTHPPRYFPNTAVLRPKAPLRAALHLTYFPHLPHFPLCAYNTHAYLLPLRAAHAERLPRAATMATPFAYHSFQTTPYLPFLNAGAPGLSLPPFALRHHAKAHRYRPPAPLARLHYRHFPLWAGGRAGLVTIAGPPASLPFLYTGRYRHLYRSARSTYCHAHGASLNTAYLQL